MPVCTCADPLSVSTSISTQTAAQTADAALFTQSFVGLATGGMLGTPAPVAFRNWSAPEITDIGESEYAGFFQAAALAIALANAAAQGAIHEKQMDLADAYYSMAKYKLDRFRNKYVPLELKLLNEVSTVPIPEMDCDDDRSRAQTAVNHSFDSMAGFLRQLSQACRLCIGDEQLRLMEHKRARALVDTENYNMYDDRFWTDYKTDSRWNRRSAVLNLGRNMAAEALKYGDVASSLLKTLGAEVDRAANGAVGAIGYFGARNDTFYPMSGFSNSNDSLISITNTGWGQNTNPSQYLGGGA